MSETIPINRFDPDYYPLQLGNHVLGGGFYATRLYHDLRQETGYVYNVDVRLNAQKTRTLYTVTYGCDPQERLEGQRPDSARSDRHAEGKRHRRRNCSRPRRCCCGRFRSPNRAKTASPAACWLARKSACRSTNRRAPRSYTS